MKDKRKVVIVEGRGKGTVQQVPKDWKSFHLRLPDSVRETYFLQEYWPWETKELRNVSIELAFTLNSKFLKSYIPWHCMAAIRETPLA